MRREDYDEGGVEFDFYIAVISEDTLPTDLYMSLSSDVWIGSETDTPISFDGVVLPGESQLRHSHFHW